MAFGSIETPPAPFDTSPKTRVFDITVKMRSEAGHHVTVQRFALVPDILKIAKSEAARMATAYGFRFDITSVTLGGLCEVDQRFWAAYE